MGSINIQDSGYIKPTNEGTQASAANRANSGTVISLKTTQFVPSLKRNQSAQPELSSNTPSEVNLGSLENMQFQLRCVLNTKNDVDMALLQHLLDMVATNGYKFMWYDYTDATVENNNGQLVYQIALNSKFGHVFTAGELTAFSVSTAFNHLHVLFNNIQPGQMGKNGLITYSLTGIVLKVEVSLI